MKYSVASRQKSRTAVRPCPNPSNASARDDASALLRDEIIRRLKTKLVGYGWRSSVGDSAEERECFAHLLPAPDATLTLVNPATDEHRVVALHFAESADAVWYACTMRLPGGGSAQEHGLLDVVSGAMRVVELRGDMTCSGQPAAVDDAEQSLERGMRMPQMQTESEMSTKPVPQQNHLLAGLPAEAQQRLFPHLELVELRSGTVLYGSDDALSDVYFPVDSTLSLRYIAELGASLERNVGNEGFVGFTLSVGGVRLPCEAVVKTAGSAYRLPGKYLNNLRLGERLQIMQRLP